MLKWVERFALVRVVLPPSGPSAGSHKEPATQRRHLPSGSRSWRELGHASLMILSGRKPLEKAAPILLSDGQAKFLLFGSELGPANRRLQCRGHLRSRLSKGLVL
jgi:hypothetical protein